MSRQVYAFEPPERFVAGTVGEPGERIFFLQARGAGQVISVVLEKLQVSLLADKLEELLSEAQFRFGVDLPDAEAADEDSEPLDTPLAEEFRVGTLELAWDGESRTVVIEAFAVPGPDVDVDEVTEEDVDMLRVRLTPAATQAFISRARKVVAAGRPPCPLCGQPLDPTGHLCPRHNGYRRINS